MNDDLVVKTLSEADWEVYRQLRLRSLQESPDAFGATYDREILFSNEKWKSRTKTSACAILLIAEVDGSPSGLANGVVHERTSKTVNIYQMWVAPDIRGSGVGRTLLKRIIDWATGLSMETVSLDVTTTNVAAVRLYETLGFRSNGFTEQLRPESTLTSQSMTLQLVSSN